MPSKPANEALLISALVNSKDVTLAQAYGVEAEMMHGYQAEYRWLLSYYQTYGSSPSVEALLHTFRGFPHTEHTDVAFLCDEVLYSHQKREAVKTVKTAASYLAEDDLEEAMLALGSFKAVVKREPLTDALGDLSWLDQYESTVDALRTPWQTLTEHTGGIRRGNYWTMASRYGQGKSWIMAALICDVLLGGQDVLLYSLEMSKPEILPRIHVLLGAALGFEVDHIAMRDRIYDGLAYRKICRAIEELVHGKLYIQDAGKVTSARVAAESPEASLTCIDYIGLMYTNAGLPAIGDWRNAATISNQLKEAAIASDSRIVVAAQINRDGDTASKMPPRSKSLAQSDAIGQDSDVIVMMKRYAHSAMAYTLDKNRHGASGISFFSNYEPNVGNFSEISKDAAEERRLDEDYTAD